MMRPLRVLTEPPQIPVTRCEVRQFLKEMHNECLPESATYRHLQRIVPESSWNELFMSREERKAIRDLLL